MAGEFADEKQKRRLRNSVTGLQGLLCACYHGWTGTSLRLGQLKLSANQRISMSSEDVAIALS